VVYVSAWTSKNQGQTSASSFSSGVYLSTDTIINTSDVLLGTASVSGLAVGAEISSSVSGLVIPAGTIAGQYYVGVLLDRGNAVAEANETNNAVVTSGFAIVAPSPYLGTYALVPAPAISCPSLKNYGLETIKISSLTVKQPRISSLDFTAVMQAYYMRVVPFSASFDTVTKSFKSTIPIDWVTDVPAGRISWTGTLAFSGTFLSPTQVRGHVQLDSTLTANLTAGGTTSSHTCTSVSTDAIGTK
jgi:hypothetical protein